jgi:hypothetical protein
MKTIKRGLTDSPCVYGCADSTAVRINDNEVGIYTTFIDMSKRFDAFHWRGATVRQRTQRQGRDLQSDDHDFGGLDERGDGLAFFQTQLANGIAGDDGGDALAADGEGDLGDQAVNFYIGDAADELVAAADAAKVGAAFGDVAMFGNAI